MTVFETFLEQDGPQDAKTGGDGEKFRMSERQRVRGTAVDSYFCESRANLVSNTVMPPFLQKLLSLEKHEIKTNKLWYSKKRKAQSFRLSF